MALSMPGSVGPTVTEIALPPRTILPSGPPPRANPAYKRNLRKRALLEVVSVPLVNVPPECERALSPSSFSPLFSSHLPPVPSRLSCCG